MGSAMLGVSQPPCNFPFYQRRVSGDFVVMWHGMSRLQACQSKVFC